jgi:hypothetical protein
MDAPCVAAFAAAVGPTTGPEENPSASTFRVEVFTTRCVGSAIWSLMCNTVPDVTKALPGSSKML